MYSICFYRCLSKHVHQQQRLGIEIQSQLEIAQFYARHHIPVCGESPTESHFQHSLLRRLRNQMTGWRLLGPGRENEGETLSVRQNETRTLSLLQITLTLNVARHARAIFRPGATKHRLTINLSVHKHLWLHSVQMMQVQMLLESKWLSNLCPKRGSTEVTSEKCVNAHVFIAVT